MIASSSYNLNTGGRGGRGDRAQARAGLQPRRRAPAHLIWRSEL